MKLLLSLLSKKEPTLESVFSIPRTKVLLGDIYYNYEGKKIKVVSFKTRSQVDGMIRHKNMLAGETVFEFQDVKTGAESYLSERALNLAIYERRLSLFSRARHLNTETDFGPK